MSDPAPISAKRALVWLERIVTFALLAFVLYRLAPQLGALTGVGPDIGRTPEFAFTALDGTDVRSDELRGRVVVLNFWATWCAPCGRRSPPGRVGRPVGPVRPSAGTTSAR